MDSYTERAVAVIFFLILIIVLGVISLFFMFGTTANIEEGIIIEKTYEEAHRETNTATDKEFYYPDRWAITIRSLQERESGEYDVVTYYTTQEVFDQHNVGDTFIYNKDRDKIKTDRFPA